MKYIILISHGDLAVGLKSAAEMMTGPKEELLFANLPDGESTDDFKKRFREVIKVIDFNTDKLIVMADIVGGSPFTSTIEILNEMGVLDNTIVLSGMNMPMLVTAIIMKDNLDDDMFVETVVNEGRGAIERFVVGSNNDDEI